MKAMNITKTLIAVLAAGDRRAAGFVDGDAAVGAGALIHGVVDAVVVGIVAAVGAAGDRIDHGDLAGLLLAQRLRRRLSGREQRRQRQLQTDQEAVVEQQVGARRGQRLVLTDEAELGAQAHAPYRQAEQGAATDIGHRADVVVTLHVVAHGADAGERVRGHVGAREEADAAEIADEIDRDAGVVVILAVDVALEGAVEEREFQRRVLPGQRQAEGHLVAEVVIPLALAVDDGVAAEAGGVGAVLVLAADRVRRAGERAQREARKDSACRHAELSLPDIAAMHCARSRRRAPASRVPCRGAPRRRARAATAPRTPGRYTAGRDRRHRRCVAAQLRGCRCRPRRRADSPGRRTAAGCA